MKQASTTRPRYQWLLAPGEVTSRRCDLDASALTYTGRLAALITRMVARLVSTLRAVGCVAPRC